MSLILLCLTLAAPPGDDARLTPDQRAAWIARLRESELEGGKTGWTQRRLREARAEVHDPAFARAPLPEWLFQFYVVLLDWYLPVWLMVFLLGALFVWRSWRRNRQGTAFLRALLWFFALGALTLALDSFVFDPHPAVVVRLDGTVLRQGNGLSYPPRTAQGLPIRLAAGVEGVVRTQRSNAWIQVELPGGVMGWVPQDAVYLVWRRGHD